MATVRTEADDLQRQMADIRSQIRQEMRGVVDGATSVADWRSYFRGRPWLAIGIAFTSGYLLVPRRSPTSTSTIVVQPPMVDVQNLQTAVPQPQEKPARLPLMRWFLGAVGPIALRAAQSYALSYIEGFLANQQAGGPPEEILRPASPGQTSRPEGRGFATRG